MKKEIKKTDDGLFKVKTILVPNWKKIPVGSKVTFIKNGSKPVSGRIQKQDNCIYLCQNSFSGAKCMDTLGYKYSWNISNGSLENLNNERVEIISIVLDEKFSKSYVLPLRIVINGSVVQFNTTGIRVGCTTVSKSVIKQVYDYQFKKSKKK